MLYVVPVGDEVKGAAMKGPQKSTSSAERDIPRRVDLGVLLSNVWDETRVP